MKKRLISVFVLILVFSLVSTGCLYRKEELRERNDELQETIDDMAGEIRNLKDKGGELLSEAEENWRLLEKCMKEKKESEGEVTEIRGASAAFDPTDLTLLESTDHDLTGDGVPDKIRLYTSAGTDEHGRMMWDDGQRFILVAETGGKTYMLFDEYVQIGRVYYMVYEKDRPGIMAAVSTYAGLQLEKYVFRGSEDIFSRVVLYDSSDINVIHNTFPWD